MNKVPAGQLRIMAACLAAICCGTTAIGSTAAETPVLQAIRAAASAALRQHYSVPGSRVIVSSTPLDPRLRLPDCPVPLHASVPERAAPASVMTVSVQCPRQGGWIVRVPLHLQVFRSVLVTVQPLQRGDGIHRTDVRSEERDVTRLAYGYIDNLDQVTGRTLARPLAPDSVLAPAALGGRSMVRAGDQVQLIAKLGDIEVRASGTALGGGDNGARLRVRNDSSGRIIDAMVSAPGVVLALP
jgi:flagella basal body P-ring formation protein FlgA